MVPRRKDIQFNILKDNIFSRSHEVLAAKRKNLVSKDKGNKQMQQEL